MSILWLILGVLNVIQLPTFEFWLVFAMMSIAESIVTYRKVNDE